MSLDYRIGDVFERLAEIPDGSIDLIVTSPPFLALRSYLPDDHPDKGKEIGSEPTPAAFIDTLLALSAEWGRVLAPHGSLCVELGDTYSGSGGAGGDYNADGLRAGQGKFDGSNTRRGKVVDHDSGRRNPGTGWPLAKSMSLIPHMYTGSMAYGRNLLNGDESPAGMWRIRNVICWARPNPPVGALGDKFRPATSYITVACKGPRRFFDLDAVRTEAKDQRHRNTNGRKMAEGDATEVMTANYTQRVPSNEAGAPPLDWHADDHPEDGDWLWKLPTKPYSGSHYAVYPLTLPTRLVKAMCPERVCEVCGKPSERIAERSYVGSKSGDPYEPHVWQSGIAEGKAGHSNKAPDEGARVVAVTVGWSDCGHDAWRTGVVLDPFAGSGTTLEAAQIVGRHAIGIDLDERNADLARERCGMFLDVA